MPSPTTNLQKNSLYHESAVLYESVDGQAYESTVQTPGHSANKQSSRGQKSEVYSVSRKLLSTKQRIHPKLRKLENCRWMISESSLHDHFGEIIYRSERFVAGLLILAKTRSFEETLLLLRTARKNRVLRITKCQGARTSKGWQPVDVEAVIKLSMPVPRLPAPRPTSEHCVRHVDTAQGVSQIAKETAGKSRNARPNQEDYHNQRFVGDKSDEGDLLYHDASRDNRPCVDRSYQGITHLQTATNEAAQYLPGQPLGFYLMEPSTRPRSEDTRQERFSTDAGCHSFDGILDTPHATPVRGEAPSQKISHLSKDSVPSPRLNNSNSTLQFEESSQSHPPTTPPCKEGVELAKPQAVATLGAFGNFTSEEAQLSNTVASLLHARSMPRKESHPLGVQFTNTSSPYLGLDMMSVAKHSRKRHLRMPADFAHQTGCTQELVDPQIRILATASQISTDIERVLFTFFPSQCLSDTAIELSLKLFQTPSFHILTSSCLAGPEALQTSSRSILESRNHRFVFAPLRVQGHWIALNFDLLESNIDFYDSLPSDTSRILVEAAALHIAGILDTQVRATGSQWSFRYQRSTIPKEAKDCGIHVVVLGAHIMFNLAIPNFIDSDFWRLLLAQSIKTFLTAMNGEGDEFAPEHDSKLAKAGTEDKTGETAFNASCQDESNEDRFGTSSQVRTRMTLEVFRSLIRDVENNEIALAVFKGTFPLFQAALQQTARLKFQIREFQVCKDIGSGVISQEPLWFESQTRQLSAIQKALVVGRDFLDTFTVQRAARIQVQKTALTECQIFGFPPS